MSAGFDSDMCVANLDRITSDPELMNGQPCIRGMRLTVKRVLEALSINSDFHKLIEEYPELEDEDIRQALTWAGHNINTLR
jgi:uncharacterized protein (DUF433 family)